MKIKSVLLIGAIFLLFFSARREKSTIYDLRYIDQNLRLIPPVTFNTGASDEDVPINNTTKSKTVKVDSFYMFRYEITNGMYCYYLHELLNINVDIPQYIKALPDTLVWREKFAYNEPYVEYYLRHPAYADYPLVGISYDQASNFCNWLTTNYNKWPDRKFQQVKFDLPTRDEWTCAANGGNNFALFPWVEPKMQNNKGQMLANFRVIDQSSIYRKVVAEKNIFGKIDSNIYLVGNTTYGSNYSGWLQFDAEVTAPVDSYYPNGFGLYNMAGNVEEMVHEKGTSKGGSWRDTGYYLRNNVEEVYSDSLPTSSERGFRIAMKVLK